MLFDIGDIPDEILSEDLGGELDLDELMAVFGDVEDAPFEGNKSLEASPASTGKRGNVSPSTSESGNRKCYSGIENASRGDVVQDKAQESNNEEEKKRQVYKMSDALGVLSMNSKRISYNNFSCICRLECRGIERMLSCLGSERSSRCLNCRDAVRL